MKYKHYYIEKYLKLKYLFIFYAILRFPLHQLTGLQDSKGRLYSMLLLISIGYYYYKKNNFRMMIIKAPYKYWGLWVVYVLCNVLIQGTAYEMKLWQVFTFITAPLVLLYFTNLNFGYDIKILLKIIIISAYLSQIIIILNEGFTSYSDGDRFGLLLNSNEIGINALLTFVFLYLHFTFSKMKLQTFLILSILPSYILLMSGSRSAFVPFAFFILTIYITKRSRSIVKAIITIVIGVSLTIFLAPHILDNLLVIERLRSSKLEGEMVVNTGTALDYLGSRAKYYVFGYVIFKNDMVFGVGLFNYRLHNPLSHQPNHVEIMIQLSELGIIGFSIFLLFNIWVGKHLIYCWKNETSKRKITEVFITGYISIVALYFVSYTYWNILVFLFLGVTITYINRTEESILRN